MAGGNTRGLVRVWCTNDGSFVFVVKSVHWVSDEAERGSWKLNEKLTRNGVRMRAGQKNPRALHSLLRNAAFP